MSDELFYAPAKKPPPQPNGGDLDGEPVAVRESDPA